MGTESPLRSRMTSLTGTFDRIVGRAGPVAVRWLLGLLWLSNTDWKVPPDFNSLRGFTAAGVDHHHLQRRCGRGWCGGSRWLWRWQRAGQRRVQRSGTAHWAGASEAGT